MPKTVSKSPENREEAWKSSFLTMMHPILLIFSDLRLQVFRTVR
jgi:hypothetical protein